MFANCLPALLDVATQQLGRGYRVKLAARQYQQTKVGDQREQKYRRAGTDARPRVMATSSVIWEV